MAEAERDKIARLLKLPADQPLFKGNLVLFVFKRSFDYSEFVQMVEKREAPRGIVGHWQAKGLDAYACVTASNDSDADLPALLAEQIAGAYLQSVSAPAWFSAGARGRSRRKSNREAPSSNNGTTKAPRPPAASRIDDGCSRPRFSTKKPLRGATPS